MSILIKFPGTEMTLGDRKVTLAPLTLRQIKELKNVLAQVKPGITIGDPLEKLDALTAVIHASLSRNHPDISREELDDMLDMKNVPLAIAAVMGLSGMVEVDKQPGGTDSDSFLTGTPSTANSSPASPDGPGNTSTTT